MSIYITPKIKDKIVGMAGKYDLKLVLLFGSEARGDKHEDSDVDIAVLGQRLLSEKDMVMINFECTLIFQSNNIDTTNLSSAPPLLQRKIIDEAKILYDRSGHDFSVFESAAVRRYEEAQPLYELTREQIEDFVAEKV